MAAPTPSWNTVRTFGTWRNGDGTLKAGAYTVALLTRVTNHTDDDIIPAGPFLSGNLQTLNNANPSLDLLLPATDDPDNDQSAILSITVTFADKSTTEVYVPAIPYADRPTGDGGTGNGLDLRKILLGDSVTVASTQYRVGIANGLALLNSSGQVIDASGNPVVGSVTSVAGKTGVVTLTATDVSAQPVDSDLTAIAALTTTAYGRAVLALANQAALMALLSASTTTAQGIVELATNTEATTGTDTARAVTPSGVAAAIAASAQGIANLPSGSLTAVVYTGSAWPARPTARTDIHVLYFALTAADPTPTDFVAGVDYLWQPVS